MGNASGGMVRTVRWDGKKGKFELMYQEKRDPQRIKKRDIFSQLLWETFMPSGELTPDYYKYTLWRLAQRFVGATSSVFGTQALVLARGFKSHSLGIAAATRWVLKDALGKVSRIFWASRHGRKFDFNAKKWRFRSALLFAAGNGFEILTYVFPAFFLILAAVANASKQVCPLFSLLSSLYSLLSSLSSTHIAAHPHLFPLLTSSDGHAHIVSNAQRHLQVVQPQERQHR
jgi:Vitamin B6 photo-protection and homoeostasis